VTDSLAAFLAAVRRPVEFLLAAPETAAARTHFPGRDLARRGRDLERRLPSPEQRRAMEGLCGCLERYETTPATERHELARRCRELLARLESRRDVAPPYQPFSGEVGAALEQLKRPIQYVRGVGPRRAAELGKFGIQTVEDLLYHLPFRYEDRRRVALIGAAQPGEELGIVGELVRIEERTVGRGRRRILEAVLRDESGLLGLTWYNQVSYFRARYRPGQRCLVYGKIEHTPGGGKRIVHPDIDLTPDEAGAGVLPVYNKPTTMTVGAIRKLVQQAVRDFADVVPSVLPREVSAAAGVCDLAAALRAVHLPAPDADVDRLNALRSAGHRALVFDELLYLQLGMALRRRAVVAEAGLPMRRRGHLTERLHALLPFGLTGAQRRVIEEIHRDAARPHPMHRLVQGDVGSGKTVVALFAALVAIENGYQVAFMAPTELLAEQHYRTVSGFVEKLGVRYLLLTGDSGRAERARRHEQLASGEVQLVVGTHALIQEGVRMPRLGLGVIDEQHRFGVLQRAALRRLRGEEQAAPDILLMTATPIPRTLAMTVYGDLDVSVIDELPPGREPVRTLVFNEARRDRIYQLVREELARGRQGYVVYPLVEASEKEDLRDATTMARELGRTVFPDYRIGLLHGKMKADEKDAIMRRFRAGDLQLLVSTTVVEVGVDVPNATIMVVEHAERFGLSQLHQLRGRVGRGADRATCVLVAPYARGGDTDRRLQALRETADGFRIAEVDLELRGPGEFLGTRQSGLPDFRVANLLRDSRLLVAAREAAEAWLERDPGLLGAESAPLRQVLRHRWSGRLGLAEIG
jgi:ATP-dependent DNA helicase RecG